MQPWLIFQLLKRYSESMIERLLCVKWWDLEFQELCGLPFKDVELCMSMVEELQTRKAGQ